MFLLRPVYTALQQIGSKSSAVVTASNSLGTERLSLKSVFCDLYFDNRVEAAFSGFLLTLNLYRSSGFDILALSIKSEGVSRLDPLVRNSSTTRFISPKSQSCRFLMTYCMSLTSQKGKVEVLVAIIWCSISQYLTCDSLTAVP